MHITSNRVTGARGGIVNIEGHLESPTLDHDAAVSIGQEICGLLLQVQPVTGLGSTCRSDGSNGTTTWTAPMALRYNWT